MRVRRLIFIALPIAVAVTAGFAWLAVGMGPLGALSLPFAAFVRVDASPCLLALGTETGSLNQAAFAQALQRYAASNGLREDGDRPTATRRLASYTGPGTLTMIEAVNAGRTTVQLFKDGQDNATYLAQVDAAIAALEPVGLNRTVCH